ncbi:MAG: hypothetical protein SWX82_12280 [Cyanobacteriota bacterium]|nr:hypothetical protein [Cyanobacteriota bacterium]
MFLGVFFSPPSPHFPSNAPLKVCRSTRYLYLPYSPTPLLPYSPTPLLPYSPTPLLPYSPTP